MMKETYIVVEDENAVVIETVTIPKSHRNKANCPCFHKLSSPKKFLLKWKEYLTAPFHRRVYGVWVLEKFTTIYNITAGQLLLLQVLAVLAAICNYHTFFKPNTGQSGVWAYYALVYSFLLAHKKASVFRLLGVSWEQLVPIHHAASLTALVLSAMHGYVAYTGHDYFPCREPTAENLLDTTTTTPFCEDLDEYGHRILGELRIEDNARFRHSMIGPEPHVWKYLWDGGRNISGSWMWFCLLVLILTSSFRAVLRRPNFDLWLVLHIAASGAVLAYSQKHRVNLYVILSIWWGLDAFLRYVWGSLFRLPKTAKLTMLSPRKEPFGSSITAEDLGTTVVELTFKRKFHYEAGQYVRVAVMETGQPVMFHPMTISSAPCEDQVTIHFRPFGGWTRQLARKAAKRLTKKSSADSDANDVGLDVHVLLEGPYGCLAMNLWNDHHRYPTVVLVAGGIGVTPISSLARQLLFEHKHKGRHRKRIHVVWAVRDLSLVESLPLLSDEISSCATSSPASSFDTDLDTYSSDHSNPAPVFVADIYLTSIQNGEISIIVDEDGVELSNDRFWSLRPTMMIGGTDIPKSLEKQGYVFNQGRPNIKQILSDAASALDRHDRIAVVACGPHSLVQATKEECARLTVTSDASFDFHEEIFLY